MYKVAYEINLERRVARIHERSEPNCCDIKIIGHKKMCRDNVVGFSRRYAEYSA